MRLSRLLVPAAFFLKDTEGRYKFINSRYADWFEIDPATVEGRMVHDMFPAERADRYDAGDRQIIKTHSVMTDEIDIPLPSGETRTFVLTKFPVLRDGIMTDIGGVMIDVTERKKAEEALRQAHDELEDRVWERTAELEDANRGLSESEKRFQSFAYLSADWFFEVDADFRYTYLSSTGSVEGLSPEDFIGKTREELLGEAFEPQSLDDELRAWRAHEPYRDVVRRSDVARNEWLQLSGEPIFAENGTFLGYRGTSTNITEQRRQEEQLHQAQKMETVGQLTGGIAHDFNNLLAIVLGNLELLEEKIDVGGELLEDARDAVLRGANLTQQLLAFSRKQTLVPEVVDVARLVRRNISLLERTLGKEIEIQSVMPNDLGQTLADRTQLETALLNIALNARDAMPGGGTLGITSANIILDDGFVTSRPGLKPGHYVLISVSDTGTGIPARHLDQVFDPFFTTKEVGKGSGLGLSMIYGFAKQSGGHVEIQTEVGSGTQVKLYLPRASATNAALDTEEKHQRVLLGGQEIVLVVEDAPEVRRMAVNLLSSMGYQVQQAGNGPEALALLDEVEQGEASGPGLRPLLHDQGGWQGQRPWPLHDLWLCQAIGWPCGDPNRGGIGNPGEALPSKGECHECGARHGGEAPACATWGARDRSGGRGPGPDASL